MKQHEGYFGMDLVILNHGQMMRTAPELAPPSPNFHATATGERLESTSDLVCKGPIHGGSSVELGFELSGPKVETLPLGHRCLMYVVIRKYNKIDK
ncbi:hypothetical protein AVEN_17051-1 [Araneus ventricosus]|uniref:Uncharacterized protein n=1 Tax=Araneus ventricosus TaxID=182803 RepID=A0A4Y2IK73_ARAVE|nr:hypothetical protein AVEN_17051-1 [Araneus ventricosus]